MWAISSYMEASQNGTMETNWPINLDNCFDFQKSGDEGTFVIQFRSIITTHSHTWYYANINDRDMDFAYLISLVRRNQN